MLQNKGERAKTFMKRALLRRIFEKKKKETVICLNNIELGKEKLEICICNIKG